MIIYKYLDEKGAIKTIKSNSVLLRTPLEYNDPFDSLFNVDEKEMNKAFDLFMNYQLFKKIYKELIIGGNKPNFLGKIVKENIKSDALKVKKELIYKKKRYLTPYCKTVLIALKKKDTDVRKQFSSEMKLLSDKLRNVTLISCFGSSFDSILMWSYYADKHKGACIEYEVDDKNFKKVEYSKDLPNFRSTEALEILFGHDFAGKDVDANKPEYQFLLNPLFIKSSDWSHEGEVRCVYSKTNLDPKIYKAKEDDKEILLLKMPKIRRIYLGCRASEEFASQIINIAGNIPVVKLKMRSFEYGLEEA